MNVIRHLPPGFTERHMRGPCNELCAHPDCPVMRAELMAWAEQKLRRTAGHANRKAMVKR